MSYDVIWDSLRKGSTTANAGLEMQQGTTGKGKNKLTFPVLQVSQDPFCGLAQLPQYVRPICSILISVLVYIDMLIPNS